MYKLTLLSAGKAEGSGLDATDPVGLGRDVGLHQGVGLQKVVHVVQVLSTVLGLQPSLGNRRGTDGTLKSDSMVE